MSRNRGRRRAPAFSTARTGLVCAVLSLGLAPARSVASEAPPAPRPHYWAYTACSEGGESAGTENWVHNDTPTYPYAFGNLNTCPEPGGALGLQDEGARDTTPESGPLWEFEAPPSSTIAGGTMNVTMMSPGGKAYVGYPGAKGTEYLASCDETCTSTRSMTVTIPDTGGWVIDTAALCKPPSGQNECSASGINAELTITTATILLHDEATPQASEIAGSLTESPVSGTASISFTAHDENGPGVYRATVRIDGQPVWAGTPNLNEGRCFAHGTYAEALNFRYAQPCPLETPVRIEVPTASIPDGPHLLEVALEDAAGNTAVVYDRTVQIENNHSSVPSAASTTSSTPPSTTSSAPVRGPGNGSPASDSASLQARWRDASSSTLRSPYGRVRQIEGRLTTSAGTPIAGAAIEVQQRPAALGAAAEPMAAATTSSSGAFTVRVPAGEPSASIELAYRSHVGDQSPAAQRTLTLRVPAHLRLIVSRHATRVGQTIWLHGRLSGPLPPSGKLVIFEARAVGSRTWIEFHNETVTGDGRFKWYHRFILPGPQRYLFRVVCAQEPAFPFLRGASNVVGVLEH